LGDEIVLQAAGPIHLAYEADLKTTDDNIIDERGILLQSNWYPALAGFSRIRLSATLPTGYVAVSEADRITQTEKGGATEFAFDFPHPMHDQRGLSFVASRRFEVSRDSYNHIELCTYLLPEKAHLAPRYLERLKLALKRYEALLGPYPYRRLAIVETRLPESEAAPRPDTIPKFNIHPDKSVNITNSSLIFPGWDRPVLEPLLGERETRDCSTALIVRSNQSSPGNIVAVINAATEEEVSALLKEAFANPSYSNLLQ
jgi:hypothetical protein